MDEGAEVEEMESEREEGVTGRAEAALESLFEGEKTELRRENGGDHGAHAARDVEEGVKDRVEDMVGNFRDLTQVQ